VAKGRAACAPVKSLAKVLPFREFQHDDFGHNKGFVARDGRIGQPGRFLASFIAVYGCRFRRLDVELPESFESASRFGR
jgi:hypothetical protein